jgi:Zn-dependent protease with chaperone function
MVERLRDPSRSRLIRQIESANRLAVPWVFIQIAASAGLAYVIDWPRIAATPLTSAIAVLAIIGPFLSDVLRHTVSNKKNIDDLKESTRFGDFDKHSLRKLVNETLLRLGLPLPGPPVYITPDKTLNAGAVHLGLGGFLRTLNGVYLNRQVLHRLTAPELQDIVGHELGHFYRYYLLSDRLRFVTLIFSALCGLLVYQWLGLSDNFAVIAILVCGSAGWYVSGKLSVGNGEAIEYLCDDYGAQVCGVATSINGLLKVGADSELQAAIHQQELLNPRHGNLNVRDVTESIEAAVPYGHTDPDELRKRVEESLARRSKERSRLSIGGFFEFAWQGDGFDGVEEPMKLVKAMQKIPRHDWETLLDRPGHIALGWKEIDKLVGMLEEEPDWVLFRVPSEVGAADDVHPPTRDRILYLWRNRNEIEAAAGRHPLY